MSDNSTQYEEIYSNSHPYGTISASYIVISSSFAIVLIFSLLIVIFKNRGVKRSTDMKLCIMLLFMDLYISIMTLLNNSFSIGHYGNYLNSRFACTLNAFLTGLPYVISITLMGIISLERCLLIVFNRSYSKKFYFVLLLIFALLNSINFILTAIFDGFGIFPAASYCFFYPIGLAGLIGSIAAVILLIPPYNLVVFCYIAISVYRRKQSQEAKLELGLDPIKVRRDVNSTIIKSLSFIAASLFTSGIYVAIMIASWFNPSILTPVTDLIQVVFLGSQMIINATLLLNIQPDLWNGLKSLYGIKGDQSL